MYKNQFALMTKRRFLPLFITQFLGAFNDNVFKQSLIIFITFKMASDVDFNVQFLSTFVAFLIIVPMALLSGTAGVVADKYEKSGLIRKIKAIEVLLMASSAAAFYFQNIYILMALLFFMGTQSTFFGPLKYSILPTHLKKDELLGGNGLIQTGTFLSILFGSLLGVMIFILDQGHLWASGIILCVALAGFLSSLFIPESKPSASSLKVSRNFLKDTYQTVQLAWYRKDIFLVIMAISWFWFLGFGYLSLFPSYTKLVLSVSEQVLSIFLTLFSFGVAIGAMSCNRLLKGRIEVIYSPLALLVMALFGMDVAWVSMQFPVEQSGVLLSTATFFKYPAHWRLMIDMFAIALMGGIYVVPLYAFLQKHSLDEERSRVIACNNFINSLLMALGGGFIVFLSWWEYSIPKMFFVMALLNLVFAVKLGRFLKGSMPRSIARLVLSTLFRVKVEGLENYAKAGQRVVIIANHTSYLDGILLYVFLPDPCVFAIHNNFVDRWWVKPFIRTVDHFGLDQTKPMAIKSLIKLIRDHDKRCVIFPEGRVTDTGALMKVYEGPGVVALRAKATLLPIRIEGAQYSFFSRLRGCVKRRWFPKIALKVCEPVTLEVPPDMFGRKRRELIGKKLYQIMVEMLVTSNEFDVPLFQSLLDAKKIYGGRHVILEDIKRKPMTYSRLVMNSFILGKYFSKHSEHGEAVGVMLPNVSVNVVVFYALQAYGRVPALLNFTSGPRNVLTACQTALVKHVVTSKAFIEAAKLERIVDYLKNAGLEITYLEDVAASLTLWNKFHGVLAKTFPSFFGTIRDALQAEKPAAIMFTSGSEGTPKAVVLSSSNFQANRFQMSGVIDFNPKDLVFNALPMFHAFGLLGGIITPILSGIRVFLYPTPLHYRIIPEMVYDMNATLFFGTSTFLKGYARYAHPYDFYSVRYVFAGAEKLQEDVRQLWAEKFGRRIFEGYGATECSPALAANNPMYAKAGTVGQILPAIEYRLETVDGIDEGGRLWVKGPNIMLGYYLAGNPGVLVPPKEGWYDTGDIVSIDEQGFVTIEGRAKRFAKVAGEMVSLTLIEKLANHCWPEDLHAVITVSDEKRGEQLILATTCQDASRQALAEYIRRQGYSELFVPKQVFTQFSLPVLASGKVNYAEIEALVRQA